MGKRRSARRNKHNASLLNAIDPLPYPQESLNGALNLGYPGGGPFTPQVSEATTTFINLRYYLISNMRQMLAEAYAEISVVQNICKIPVQDALRGGVEIKSQQLEEDDLEKLKNSLDRDNEMAVVAQAEIWNRLHGGAGVIVLTDQDPSTPLDVDAIGPDDRLEFRAVDMWELFWSKQDVDGVEGNLDPEVDDEFSCYTYYGEQLHKSRVIKLKGVEAPSFLRPRLRGWGMSVVEPLIRSMNQYLKATDLTFEVLDEFKIDVYGIKNLVNILMSPDGGNEVKKRVSLLNYLKNYQNAIVLDSEDTYNQKQLSFAGIADIMQQIRMQIASDVHMPMLKLFGTPAQGLNASDEDSLEVYNNMVDSEIRGGLKYPILRMLEMKCQKLFGFVPDDLSIDFKPLRDLSAVDQESVKTSKFNRLIQAMQQGLLTKEEFRDACNKGDLFDITLDNTSLGQDVGLLDPEQQPAEVAEAPTPEPTPTATPPNTPTAVPNSVLRLVNNDETMQNPGNVDEAIWEEAKAAVKKKHGTIHWPIVMTVYKRMGGKTSSAA